MFQERLLPVALEKYCVHDVLMMPALLDVYGRRFEAYGGRLKSQATQIQEAVLQRIALSKSPDFNGKGHRMAVGPVFRWTRYVLQIYHLGNEPHLERANSFKQ